MYKITYADDSTKSMRSGMKEKLDVEVQEELSFALEELKKKGGVTGASCGVRPGIVGLFFEIQGRTFQVSYAVDSSKRVIYLYDFKLKSHVINWKEALEENCCNGDKQPIQIPQIGDPRQLLKALQLVSCGVNTPIGLGRSFKSPAKKDKDISRRGYYFGLALVQLDLARIHKSQDTSTLIYLLTERGHRICQDPDLETRERLLVEALLRFLPIQMIINETTRGERELSNSRDHYGCYSRRLRWKY
jgi:hypothetical protein